MLDTMLAEIYRRGRELGFKPPPQQRSRGEEALPQDGTGAGLPVKKVMPVSMTASASRSVRVPAVVRAEAEAAAPVAAAAAVLAPATAPSVDPKPTAEGGDGSASVSADESAEKPDTLA